MRAPPGSLSAIAASPRDPAITSLNAGTSACAHACSVTDVGWRRLTKRGNHEQETTVPHGIRTMVHDTEALYVGTANPMNLNEAGGRELIKLTPR
jgi:hypothetical protein